MAELAIANTNRGNLVVSKGLTTANISEDGTTSLEYQQSPSGLSQANTDMIASLGAQTPISRDTIRQPEPGYFADERELARLTRGESQPQLMTSSEMSVKFSTSDRGAATLGVGQTENKSIILDRDSNHNLV